MKHLIPIELSQEFGADVIAVSVRKSQSLDCPEPITYAPNVAPPAQSDTVDYKPPVVVLNNTVVHGIAWDGGIAHW